MKNVYVVCTYERNGKRWATAWKVGKNNNLLTLVSHCADKVKSLNVFTTWKEAKQIETHWNNCYKENGTYLF